MNLLSARHADTGRHGKKVVMSSRSEGPARQLPANPDLRHLKDQAKDLLKAGQAESLARAQFQIAAQYGFASWPKLKAHVESLQLAGQLKLAIDAEDLKQVKRLMTRHPELHRSAIGPRHDAPLTWVASCYKPPSETRLAMARWMIEHGSDIHQGNDSALMRVVGDDTALLMTELLVTLGADVNAIGSDGTYPVILFPLELFAPRTLKYLIDHGADLHAAARYCNPIEMLVCIYMRRARDKGACLEIVEAAGFALPDTPVMALHRGRLDLLQEHFDRDPLLLERRFTHREVFSTTLDGPAGDAYPATPVSGGTLLHLALEFDDIDVARWLIERGADVNARAAIDAEGIKGHTPIFHTVVNLAAGMGLYDDSKTTLLLDHGADPNARATFPREATFHNHTPAEPFHDVTPIGYARRYPDRRCVNTPALAAITNHGGEQ
jgi:ankyrin repeat protein